MDVTNYKNTLPTGYILKNYEILTVLGGGGFGIVYLAQDSQLETKVVIKEYYPIEFSIRDTSSSKVFPHNPSSTENYDWGLKEFINEARTIAKFDHNNIVRVLRYIEANNTAYIVMPYIEGSSLSQLAKNETATEEEIHQIVFPLLEGLKEVHRHSYLHRDIKPSNIFITDNTQTPILIDFGAARYSLGSHSKSITSIVTQGYSPFEQYQTRGDQGPWTDIYAMGAVIYRLISGHQPIEASERVTAIMNGSEDPLPPASQIGQGLYSDTLLKAVDHALMVVGKDRPQTIDEWLPEFTVEYYKEEAVITDITPKPDEEHIDNNYQQPLIDENKNSVPYKFIIPAFAVLAIGGYLFLQDKSPDDPPVVPSYQNPSIAPTLIEGNSPQQVPEQEAEQNVEIESSPEVIYTSDNTWRDKTHIYTKNVVNPRYGMIGEITDDIAVVEQGEKWGIISPSGKWHVAPRFKKLSTISENLIAAKDDSGWNFINTKGDFLSSTRYEKIDYFSEGLAAVKVDGKWGYINKQGSQAIEPQFKRNRSFRDGLAPVKKDKKWGYIDSSSNWVIPARFDNAYSFREGKATVVKDKSRGFINKSGNYQIVPKFERVHRFNEGLAPVRLNKKYGFINDRGKTVIPHLFDNTRNFKEGLAPVKTNEKWGYIDTDGKMVIAAQFDDAKEFQDGVAVITIGTRRGVIDNLGRLIITPLYTRMQNASNGYIPMSIGKDWGILHSTLEYGSEYILPDSSTRKLQKIELAKLNLLELRIARNEIYARHGYQFNNLHVKHYFSKMPWYQARGTSVTLNESEKANIQLIKSIENQRLAVQCFNKQGDDGEILSFIKEIYNISTTNNVAAMVNLYTPTADFFNELGTDHSYIQADKERYTKRWPTRRNWISSNPVITWLSSDTAAASYNIEYSVENSRTSKSGEVRATLTLIKKQGSWKISGIHNEVVKPE